MGSPNGRMRKGGEAWMSAQDKRFISPSSQATDCPRVLSRAFLALGFRVNQIGYSLGFKYNCGVDCNGRAGGLWVGWHDGNLVEDDIEDKIVWGPTKCGEYSVKSGYRQALIRHFPDYCRPDLDWLVWKRLWQLKIPPKWILFVWKCLHNILPVKGELKKRGLNIDPICSRCFQHEESIEHLFFDCPISQRVWRGLVLGLDFGVGRPLSFFSWFRGWVQHIHDSKILIHSIGLLWAIWLQRNSVEFHSATMSIEHTITTTTKLLSIFLSPQHHVSYELSHSCNFPQNRIANQVILRNVAPPTVDVWRICIVVDGSWLLIGERTGLAWVCFDNHQLVYEEAILGPPILSPQQIEAAAVLQALRWVYSHSITRLLLQTDCLVLVLLFQNQDQDND
ncbi:uncharacterized protein LOC114286545 [Camellia sinensis]|uniref:uncharacterized protein LOC114286545 n=1 Tax=Camellia sinensis TaxID=4442 RepID=UPI00103597A8|nr:uncharacterized protein LOC114286545 [Camellia sinensis]